jgi:hypothetical protein
MGSPGDVFGATSDPTTHTPLALSFGWGKDFMNASNFVVPLFTRVALKKTNLSLVGATPAELRGWGYKVTSTPSIESQTDYCQRLVGSAQLRCWVSLDQYLTEQVIPWIPLIYEANIVITSPRVVAYSYDQFAIQPALDRIALKPGS